jgi:hypothetical protein
VAFTHIINRIYLRNSTFRRSTSLLSRMLRMNQEKASFYSVKNCRDTDNLIICIICFIKRNNKAELMTVTQYWLTITSNSTFPQYWQDEKWHSSHLLAAQNQRSAYSDAHASFEVGRTFRRTHMHAHVYQMTEKKLNVSVSCYSCGPTSAHIVGLLSHVCLPFLVKKKKTSRVIIESFFSVLFF